MRIKDINVPGAIGRQRGFPLIAGREADSLLRGKLRWGRPSQTGKSEH